MNVEYVAIYLEHWKTGLFYNSLNKNSFIIRKFQHQIYSEFDVNVDPKGFKRFKGKSSRFCTVPSNKIRCIYKDVNKNMTTEKKLLQSKCCDNTNKQINVPHKDY